MVGWSIRAASTATARRPETRRSLTTRSHRRQLEERIYKLEIEPEPRKKKNELKG